MRPSSRLQDQCRQAHAAEYLVNRNRHASVGLLRDGGMLLHPSRGLARLAGNAIPSGTS